MATKIIIVGGVAGGATAAARARRIDESAIILLFERGQYVSFANCGLPYYIGGVINNRNALLVTTPKVLRDRYNIDVRTSSEVTAIDRETKRVQVKNLTTGETYYESYDKLILSPGAEPIRPPIPGMNPDRIFQLRTIPDADRIKAYVESGKPESAVVIGGGFIGLEMAENLVLRGVKTTIVEMLDQVMAPLDYEMAAMVHRHLIQKGANLELSNGVKAFSDRGDRLLVSTSQDRDLECDFAILAIGIRPENKLAKDAGLELGERGGIKVDATLRTSDPDIFAIGDAAEIRDYLFGWPTMTALAGPANKQGRIAADNASGRRVIFKGTTGSAVVKVFDLTVAATGAGGKILKKNNVAFTTSHTFSASHADYYPGGVTMGIKLIYAPGTGKLYGAQIVGGPGVDKRIDILATAIRGGLTVFDLEELELAYAPPYSSAKDPVNIAGFVAANKLRDDLSSLDWSELNDLNPDRVVFLDVREPIELQRIGVIEGALNIPLGQLRTRLAELNRDKEYIVYCAVGMRAYVAHRILRQNGFKSSSLSGGFTMYFLMKDYLNKIRK
ncbi:MAG: FAD-dependent oxidoreductase [Deltaproteobacteria bacterium]|nr:FAD-dependent oxidoreductase [Deltaproteobacteria bacterium]